MNKYNKNFFFILLPLFSIYVDCHDRSIIQEVIDESFVFHNLVCTIFYVIQHNSDIK